MERRAKLIETDVKLTGLFDGVDIGGRERIIKADSDS